MGVVYKLNSEIKEYILKKKQEEPNLSCRKLASLVLENFQIKLSKSTINSIIKAANLSMPVGRRRKKRRLKPQVAQVAIEEQCSGAILLKAADYLVKGSHYINETIKNRLNNRAPELLAKTEALIYLSLFDLTAANFTKPDYALWALINQRLTREEISAYIVDLQSVRALHLEISQVILNIFQEVRCVKVSLSDGRAFYLDGQMRTIWSTPQIPYSFSATLYNVKGYIKKFFQEEKPIVLFMAPGYDTPIEEFFDFLLGWRGEEKAIQRLTLYSNKLEEIEAMGAAESKQRFLVFGLWPWQFGAYRRVRAKGEFRPFYSEILKEELNIAELELELFQPTANKGVILKGCILNTVPQNKIRLVILSNLYSLGATPEEIANLYLQQWPNLEEAFQDINRKTELFTYTATSQGFFSRDSLNVNRAPSQGKDNPFQDYLADLDAYVRWYFMPSGYENTDFPTMKERFYNLPAVVKRQKDYMVVIFKAPGNYPFLKDLEYACRRINEREVAFGAEQRLWLGVG